jgi:Arc/MetJ-type ribon-helix-helix transcriptional regulator
VDRLVDGWIREGRFANRSEAFRAGIFALKDRLATEALDQDFVTIVRELDRHPGGEREPAEENIKEITRLARKHRKR